MTLLYKSKCCWLKPSSIANIDILINKEIKKIKKKYAKRIQQDWYDFSDDQINERIRQIDNYYDSLHQTLLSIHEKD